MMTSDGSSARLPRTIHRPSPAVSYEFFSLARGDADYSRVIEMWGRRAFFVEGKQRSPDDGGSDHARVAGIDVSSPLDRGVVGFPICADPARVRCRNDSRARIDNVPMRAGRLKRTRAGVPAQT